MSLKAGIVQRALAYIAEEMGSVLKRSAVSPNIRERLDMSCAVLDDEGRVLAQAEHIPVHLGSLSWAARRLLSSVRELVEDEGDVVIVNDPYLTGTHLNDVTVITKYKNMWIVNKAHHVDIGGPVPGSLNPEARTLYEEGLVIEPQLVAKGWELVGLARELASKVRNPKVFEADLKAQVAALRAGSVRLRELEERYGSVEKYKEAFLSSSRKVYSEALQGKEGEGEAEVPLELPDGSFAKIRVRLKVSEAVEADFSGTSPQVPFNLNAVEGVAYAALSFFVKAMTVPEGPVDEGLYSLVKVRTEEGSLLNPRFPAAVGAGNLETSQRTLEVILLAAQFLDAPSAGPGTMSNLILSWKNKVYYETNGGGGSAAKDSDGENAVQWGMTNTMNTPIEVLEQEMPVLFTRYSVRRGSGGAGKHKGGDGVVRELVALDDMRFTVIMSRYSTSSKGVKGGKDGRPGRVLLDGRELPGYASGELKKGSKLTLETPGAGGWGEV